MTSNREIVTRPAVVVLPEEIDAANAGAVSELLGAAIVPGVSFVVLLRCFGCWN